MATKRSKRDSLDISELSGLPLMPLGDAKPKKSPVKVVANTLDTALLVLVVIVAIAVAWWLIASVISTILFFAKLAALALVVAVLIRAWLWVRRRRG